MSTFVNDHISRLDTDLTTALRVSSPPSESSDVTTTEAALESGDKAAYLTIATRSIDLHSQSQLPNLGTVQALLEQYAGVAGSEESTTLDWLFLAKCTVAVYGTLLHTLLNSTLPLSQSIEYWNSIYGSTRYEAYYFASTLPARSVALATSTVHRMKTTHLGLGTLLRSSEHILTSVFPTARRQLRVADMIHQEVGHKKKMLERFRKEQATRLGLLMKKSPNFGEHDDLIQQSCQCLYFMKWVLSDANMAADNAEMMLSQPTEELILSPKAAVLELHGLIKALSECQQVSDDTHAAYKPPSLWTRYWIPALLAYVAADAGIKVLFKHKEDIQVWARELADTAVDFAVNWVWEPVCRVWDTIRMKDQRLGVLSKEGLKSDLDSLERMVVQFAHDHYQLSPGEIDNLMLKVRDGDLSVVLKAYENEIKRPLKNAITGDLIQTLLIQVQKTKVDVDLAMAALDKLLKSNELNFAFLAVAPSMLLSWASFTWLKNLYRQRTGRQVGRVGQPIRETMRRIERIFDLSLNDTSQLDCEGQGTLLCEVHLLRTYALRLPKRNSVRELFFEDLRDLENPNLQVNQKLLIISRMGRSWDFLQPTSSYKI